MTWILIISLIIVGLLFIILEILVIPGVVVGIIGVLLMIFGISGAYMFHGSVAGHYTIGSTLLFTIVSLYFTFKSKTWNKLMLKEEISSKMNVVDENLVKAGDVGKAISRINPMGKASINGNFYEVRSNGHFIDENTEIEVIKIDSTKIIVKPKN